ncbi:GNAT family N-acetyltransferase [Crocinitomix catalasitica]|uniref:GNAT family N-acetyltransferase n=1 Tax=Crocinitomix catalasitica TaxID=184607 RepID=UPI000A07622E|nr:GNAT family N-acetyltransferase [Crocinitomix catalasitica]
MEGKIAKIEYFKTLDKIFITHTEVPKELGGQGIASALINADRHEIERNKLKLISRCPFVTRYLEKHPEWDKILAHN